MKYLIPTLFTLLLLTLFFGSGIYLANSFAWFFGINSIWLLRLVFSGLVIFSIIGTMSNVNATSTIGHYTFSTAAILMGFFLYLILATLALNIVGLFIKTEPAYYGFASVILATAVSIYGIINASTLNITQNTINIKGLTQPIKALHITDTHLGHYRGAKKLEKIAEKINQQNVDVVFFTGDLLDSTIQLNAESMAPLKKIKAPIFFIEGNHDQYTGVDAIKGYLKSIGVKVLENQVTHWNGLQIVGLNHMAADSETNDIHAGRGARVSVKSVLEALNIDADLPTVLLHHGPNGIKHANKAGVDLYLAGHTHAGQMWPATFIAKLMFEYNRGLHDYNGTKVYVNQGTGTFGPPMRVGTKSELAILQLEPLAKA